MFKDHTCGKINDYKCIELYVDGGCEPKNPGGSATSGWVIYDCKDLKTPLVEQGEVVQKGGPLATNNYGEYSALILSLKWLVSQNWRGNIIIKADSKLLIEQVSGRWKVKAEHLKPLKSLILNSINDLNLDIINENDPLPSENKTSCKLLWIQRDFNEYANDLCRKAYKESLKGM